MRRGNGLPLPGRQMRCPGILVAHDAETSAGQVVCLLEDPALARRLARNAPWLVEEKYTWERAVALLLEGAYRRAGETRGRGEKVTR